MSNIVDENYVGVEKALKAWGPLLNTENRYATLLGYFMNWNMFEKKATPEGLGSEAMAEWVKKRMDRAEVRCNPCFGI